VLAGEEKRRTLANRLKSYRPYPKQKLFHDFGLTCTERLLRAGNQQGKTWAGAMEMAMHLTGRYPAWWRGRRFDHAIDAWAACDTGETTRDNPQTALLGPWGSGAMGGNAGTSEAQMEDLIRRDQSDPKDASLPLRSGDFEVFPGERPRERRADSDRAGGAVGVGYSCGGADADGAGRVR
jgi:hypothetical protein